MKKLLLAFVLCLFSAIGYSQELKTPATGKSIVYFVRPSSVGYIINFKLFDSERYLGKFNGGKYMAYECDPGHHVFMVKSENKDFLEADLEEGKVYIVNVQPRFGWIKAAVRFKPLTKDSADYEKKKERFIRCINEGGEYRMSDSQKQEGEEKYAETIKKVMQKYNKRKQRGKVYAKMGPDSYIKT